MHYVLLRSTDVLPSSSQPDIEMPDGAPEPDDAPAAVDDNLDDDAIDDDYVDQDDEALLSDAHISEDEAEVLPQAAVDGEIDGEKDEPAVVIEDELDIEFELDADDEVMEPAADLAALAGAPIVPEEPKRAPGRPRLPEPDMSAPIWPGEVASSSSVEALLSRVYGVIVQNNMTDRAAKDVFELLAEFMPSGHTIPNHAMAERMILRHSPVQAKHYVVCLLDCFKPLVEMTPIENMSDAEIATMKSTTCATCKELPVDAKGRWRKVSCASDNARA